MQQDLKNTRMQKDMIIQKLREQGLRITKQRLMLLDIILKRNCSCCKEIYFEALKQDEKIGPATVYRMINTLEEIGAIKRENMYKIACNTRYGAENTCTIQFDDDSTMELSEKKYNQIIQTGLSVCGYVSGKKVRNVVVK